MRRRRIPLRPSLRFPSLSEQPGRGSPGRPPRQRGPAVTRSSGDAHGPGVTHNPGSLTAPDRRRPPRAHRADRKRERSAGRRERGARAPSRGRPGTAGVSHRCGGLGRRRSSGERRNAAGSERTGRPRCGKRLQGRGAGSVRGGSAGCRLSGDPAAFPGCRAKHSWAGPEECPWRPWGGFLFGIFTGRYRGAVVVWW